MKNSMRLAMACFVLLGLFAALGSLMEQSVAAEPPATSKTQQVGLELIGQLDANGSYVCRQGSSLFLTSDLRKNPGPGYWLELAGDPRSPKVVCGTLPGAWDVAVADGHAFVCDYTKFLSVYAMKEDGWQEAARLGLPSMSENLIVRDKLAYVANHTAGMTIVDVATPSEPRVVSNFDPKIDCDAIGLQQNCAVLYGHWESRLVLVDVTDPAKPRELGVYQHGPKTFNQGELAICDGFAYCTGVGGLAIVDITDPKAPKLAKDLVLGGRVSDVVVDGGYAFLAAGPRGVCVFDISDPTAPVEVGHYRDTPKLAANQVAVERTACSDTASGIAVARGEFVIYVANAKGPAMVLRFQPPGGSKTGS